MSDEADLDQRVVQEVIGRFAAPAFMRRAKLVETTWLQLIERGKTDRSQLQEFVRLRLGQLLALAGNWDVLREVMPAEDDLAYLQHLHAELQPQLRVPLEQTRSPRVLKSALRELVDTMESFNARWANWLAKVDLQPINQARTAYNRFYLLEKECALGSARVAKLGFQPLPALTVDDVAQQLPLLRIPRIVS